MKDNTDKKISEAGKVSKSQIVDKIKSENAERYDQMLIDSEIVRNDVFYINFKASYVNLIPKKAAFAMLPSVKNYFDNNCCGGASQHGDVCEVDKKFIKSITSSECNIAEKEYSGSYQPNNFKSNVPYQFLRKGLMSWNDPNAKSESITTEKKSSLLGNIKNAAGSISSAVNSLDDKINNLGDKLNNSLKWLDDGKGKSQSEEYSSLKSNYFSQLKFDYNGSKISETQPTYFIPEMTYSETCSGCHGEKYVDCEKCKARHEYTCPSCNGSGELTCYSCKGSGIDKDSSSRNVKCQHCNGRGSYKCSHSASRDGLLGTAITRSVGGFDGGKERCDGRGIIICNKCYGDSARYGKVDCSPCKATGEIGKIVYIEIEVGTTAGEFYKYTNETIEQIQKNPDILFNYLNKSDVKPQIVYTDINGTLTEKYDSNSNEFCKSLEDFASLMKEDEYPRIVSEEVFYDVIPLSTLEYNHILSGTMHKVSAVPKVNGFDIHFHSNPTSVKKFDIGNVFKSAGWNFKKAFATKSYKNKLDKKHELYLLVRVAKADGVIEDSEKRVLVEIITNLREFTGKEKSEFFNLFSMKELPPLSEEETVFSTKDRAELAIQNLNKMMKEDGEIEAPEVKLISSLKEKINANVGKHPGFFASFFKTWQVSLPLIILLLSVIGITIYSVFFSPKLSSNEEINSETNTNISDTTTKDVEEAPTTENYTAAEEQKDTMETLTEETPPASDINNELIGEWIGAFGNDQILINIESINEDGSVTGFNIVKNNKRALTGFKNGNEFELKEPGDDKWDGVFKFTITENIATGTWTANNGKSTKQFSLSK